MPVEFREEKMNRSRFFLLVILGLVLAASALHPKATALALSRADNQITWGYTHSQTIQPGSEWWSKDGYHIRERVDIGRAHGDIEGVVTVVYNGDFKQEFVSEPPSNTPLTGRAYGTIEIRDAAVIVPGWDAQATWVGEWAYDVKDGVVVHGHLWAVHTEAPEMMIVDQVWQATRTVIVHAGFIDQLYCPDADCPGPGDQ
jgi:hypothetical protein